MTYLFIGEDRSSKDAKIEEIKKQVLLTYEANQFDFEIIHSYKLGALEFKKALITLPTIAKQRILVLRVLDRLKDANKKLVLDFSEKEETKVILIIDAEREDDLGESFIKHLMPVAKILRFKSKIERNVFDITRMISNNKTSEALNLCNEVISEGTHPLQLMGGLVWFWGDAKRRVSETNYKKGLLFLKEADLNIKRSRLEPQQAVEILITKLSLLLSG